MSCGGNPPKPERTWGLPEVENGFLSRCKRLLAPESPASKIEFVGFAAFGVASDQRFSLRRRELQSQGCGDASRNRILDRKNMGEYFFEMVGLYDALLIRAHHLQCHSDLLAGLLKTATDDEINFEF